MSEKNELKACPFCGEQPVNMIVNGIDAFVCGNQVCSMGAMEIDEWGVRPIEDKLRAERDKWKNRYDISTNVAANLMIQRDAALVEVAALKAALENIRKWINHFPHQMNNEDDVIDQYRSNAARVEKIINAALKGGDA